MLGQTELSRRDLIPQLMAEVWPPKPPRPRRIDVPAAIRFPSPASVPRPRRARGGSGLRPAEFQVSDASRKAAAAARPGPPSRPLALPVGQNPIRRRHEQVGGLRPSVRVADMGPLARVMLPDELRSRRWIWPDEADRANAAAVQWAKAGFDDRSVLAWLPEGLSPADAGYLAARGVEPEVLNKLVPVPHDVVATGTATVQMLVISGRLPVAAVFDALVKAGLYVPHPGPELTLTEPSRSQVDRPPPPAVEFSHPGDVDDPTPSFLPSLRRRKAKASQSGRRRRRPGR